MHSDIKVITQIEIAEHKLPCCPYVRQGVVPTYWYDSLLKLVFINNVILIIGK